MSPNDGLHPSLTVILSTHFLCFKQSAMNIMGHFPYVNLKMAEKNYSRKSKRKEKDAISD